MNKRKILLLCVPDPNNNPRPNRMIHGLNGKYKLTVVGGAHINTEGIRSYSLHKKGEKETFFERVTRSLKKYYFYGIQYAFFLITKQYESIYWAKYNLIKPICDELSDENFDLIVSHDLVLLPLVFAIKGSKRIKVILDAREFYPKDVDDSFLWRVVSKKANEYLCEKYLSKCDKVITVSDGIAEEYAQIYDIPKPDVVMSLPYSYQLEPSVTSEDSINLIYHGNANSSRQTELMIEMMDFADSRFTLDLMLINKKSNIYWQKINSMAQERQNVRVIAPVRMKEIVPFTNTYDMGVFFVPPTNFNLEYTLPNKFFEFIQARLAVAIGPSIEMSKLVRKYDCGIISENFSPESLAKELNQLTSDQINYYKAQSNKAAKVLNAETNKSLVLDMVHKILEE